MVFTVIMFLVLIVSFALMFALVEFSENVIARPQVMPADGGTATETEDAIKPL